MSTQIATIAGKVIKKSQRLRERYREELDKLMGKEKYELAVEVARLTQEQAEQVSFAAQVQKEMIENWTDSDYAEMEVDKDIADTELGFTSIILPMAKVESEWRKAKAKDRLGRLGGRLYAPMAGGRVSKRPCGVLGAPYRLGCGGRDFDEDN